MGVGARRSSSVVPFADSSGRRALQCDFSVVKQEGKRFPAASNEKHQWSCLLSSIVEGAGDLTGRRSSEIGPSGGTGVEFCSPGTKCVALLVKRQT